MPKEIPTITLGELRQYFDGLPDSTRISFSGLEFSRTKWRDSDLLQIEFRQQVFLDDKGNVVVQNLE
jgi:hypothetical protein